MKKIIRICAAILVVSTLCSLLFIGCSKPNPDPTEPSAPATQPTVPATRPTEPAATQPAPTVPAPTDPAPTIPPVTATNPLTGEALSAASNNRPFAVSLNNVKAAMPQLGVSHADVLCEVMTEGGTTRCVGIFNDLNDIATLGSIRSARPYMISLAQSFDAIFVHAGCSTEAKKVFEETGWDHLDGVSGKGSSKYYYRDQDRLNAGYAKEHTMCITPENVLAYAQKLNLTMARPNGVEYGWQFSDEVSISGSAAANIRIRFSIGSSTSDRVKATIMAYDAETGLYYATQHGKAWTDSTTNQQIAFRNVLVLRCDTQKMYPDQSLLKVDMIGSGTGYYACGGQMIPIRWTRATATDPFTFTLEDGTSLTLAIGKSYIGFVSNSSVIDFS